MGFFLKHIDTCFGLIGVSSEFRNLAWGLWRLPKLIGSHKPTRVSIYITEYRSPSEHLISSHDGFEWAKPVAMELLVARMS